ncbi:GerAB/ArcD/ProY family transporter [Evansella halocellulosilytica]|uniref:GerAB/ArcD/ProY family transporter n=1 Tax=Evansella halocellulosilytica TaxID=2011013 RepID=UPI000BB924B9|nr:GerAB/ArcD/ProY family transporter [Evansella halocellulosilytica]
MENSPKVTLSQFFFLVIQTQVGIGVLSLPFVVYEESQWDGWVSILLSGVAIHLISSLLFFLAVRFEKQTFFSFVQSIIGPIIGQMLNFFYLLYFAGVTALVLTLYYQRMDTWLLPQTPKWVMLLLLIIPAIYLTREKLHIIARFYLFVSGLIVVIIGVLLSGYTASNPLYIFPIGQAGFTNILLGAYGALQAMLGFELILFIFPYIKGTKKQIYATYSASIWFTTLLYTFTAITTYMFFSPEEIKLVPSPVLYMLKAFTSPFIDRLDLVFVSMWIVSVTTSLMTYLFLASVSASQLFPSIKREKIVTVLGIFIYLVVVFFGPINDLSVDIVSEFIDRWSVLFFLAIPTILLILSFLLHKPIKQKGKETAS